MSPLFRRRRSGTTPPAEGGSPAPVDFGSLRRLEPLSRVYGFDRGLPVDRAFIEAFLERQRADIRGRVLEIGDDSYTRRFGGERVVRSDVLDVREGAPGATLIGDFESGTGIPTAAFDCVIFTQTLQFLFDLHAAVRHLHRLLAPRGVLLATMPGISQLSLDEWRDRWYWSFTELSIRRLFEKCFAPASIQVEAWGNVLTSVAFLEGLASKELAPEELARRDPLYPMLITLRAERDES